MGGQGPQIPKNWLATLASGVIWIRPRIPLEIAIICILTNPPGIPGLSREIQGILPWTQGLFSQIQGFWVNLCGHCILLNAIEAKCMNRAGAMDFRVVRLKVTIYWKVVRLNLMKLDYFPSNCIKLV